MTSARFDAACGAALALVLGVVAPVASSGATAEAVRAESAAPDAFETPLPLAPPADGYRSEVERAWFRGGDSLAARASSARLSALQLGAPNASAPARALVAPAAPGAGLGEALLAVKLAPDLPLARVSLARVHWADGDYAAAAAELLAGFAAIPRNLEATLWLASAALVMFCAVLALGSMGFIALAGLSVAARGAHDLGDLVSKSMPSFARAGLLSAVLAVPVLLGEGAAGLVLALFALGFVYGAARLRVALALAAVLLVLGVFPLARVTGRVLGALDADPVAAATLAVVQGIESDAEIELLRASEDADDLAEHALAVHARRTGRLDEAFRRYRALHAERLRDPVVATNLANLYFHGGALDEAIALYEVAAELAESPVLFFNLSQAYARSFKMEEFELALSRAQALDPDVVAELSAQEDASLISDLPIPVKAIRGRMLASSGGAAFGAWMRAPLLPGRLGEAWSGSMLAFAVAGLLATLVSVRFEHASACRRCGRRICARCDGTVWNNESCENCHRLFNHPEATESSLRMVRLGQLRDREERLDRLSRAASLVVPGMAGLIARRPDLAFISILLFGWSIAAVSWRFGIVPDPLVVGATGPMLFVATAALSALGYAATVVRSLSIRRSL